ncbi:uncharacterized protein LOC143019531 isoform X4 [Oratosquilla oratoria]|uniref:uncharacterized protein LOC143019531 isoform X4 n=1 Tax=Oratosquilla oratoria TaxID=337810 RepID=UPI003F75C573
MAPTMLLPQTVDRKGNENTRRRSLCDVSIAPKWQQRRPSDSGVIKPQVDLIQRITPNMRRPAPPCFVTPRMAFSTQFTFDSPSSPVEVLTSSSPMFVALRSVKSMRKSWFNFSLRHLGTSKKVLLALLLITIATTAFVIRKFKESSQESESQGPWKHSNFQCREGKACPLKHSSVKKTLLRQIDMIEETSKLKRAVDEHVHPGKGDDSFPHVNKEEVYQEDRLPNGRPSATSASHNSHSRSFNSDERPSSTVKSNVYESRHLGGDLERTVVADYDSWSESKLENVHNYPSSAGSQAWAPVKTPPISQSWHKDQNPHRAYPQVQITTTDHTLQQTPTNEQNKVTVNKISRTRPLPQTPDHNTLSDIKDNLGANVRFENERVQVDGQFQTNDAVKGKTSGPPRLQYLEKYHAQIPTQPMAEAHGPAHNKTLIQAPIQARGKSQGNSPTTDHPSRSHSQGPVHTHDHVQEQIRTPHVQPRVPVQAESPGHSQVQIQTPAPSPSPALGHTHNQVRARAPVPAPGHAQIHDKVQAQTGAQAQAQTGAQAQVQAQAQVPAPGHAQIHDKVQAQTGAQARVQAQVQVQAPAPGHAQIHDKVQAQTGAQAQFQVQAQAQAQAQVHDQAQSRSLARGHIQTQSPNQNEVQSQIIHSHDFPRASNTVNGRLQAQAQQQNQQWSQVPAETRGSVHQGGLPGNYRHVGIQHGSLEGVSGSLRVHEQGTAQHGNAYPGTGAHLPVQDSRQQVYMQQQQQHPHLGSGGNRYVGQMPGSIGVNDPRLYTNGNYHVVHHNVNSNHGYKRVPPNVNPRVYHEL